MRLSVNFANEARLQPNLEAGKRNRQVARDAKVLEKDNQKAVAATLKLE